MAETPGSKVEKWAYPLKVEASEVTDPMQYYKALAKAQDGYYPLGSNGLWHGGVHFDESTGLVADKSEVRCIADGEVVAYRIDDKYPTSNYGSAPSVFSTGFVLVKHRLELPAPPAPAGGTPAATPPAAGPSLTFFSLYMHLLDWEGYKASPALKRPEFWGKGSYQVKANAPDKSLGLRVRSGNSGQTSVLTVLPRGTTVVTQPAPATQKWLEIISVSPEVAGLAANTGWVFKGEMQHLSGDIYFVGEEAKDVPPGQKSGANVRSATSAGLPIGFLPAGTEIKVGAEQTNTRYRKLLEIVSGASIPPLTAGADGQLPGYVWFASLEGKSQPESPGEVVPVVPPHKIKAGDLVGHVGKYQNHSDPVAKNLLHLEVFSCEDVKAFTEQSKTKATSLPATEKTLVKVPKETKLITHVQGMNTANPPKASDPGKVIGYDLLIPVGVLEALPAEKRIKVPVVMAGVTTYTYWWHLEGLLADAQGHDISGWFAEPDTALSRHSPFEWEGFTFIEETVSNVDHYAAFLHAQESMSEEEQATYQPNVVTAGAGPATQALYTILDRNGDKKLPPQEIRDALNKPWFAQPVSQMVTKYESEWDYKAQKWDSLDELMGHSDSSPHKTWVEEKARIEKLSWWGSLVGQHGIAEAGRVSHAHPVGMLSAFAHQGGCSCSEVITKEQMKVIAPAATQANIDKYTDLLTDMYAKAAIVSCISKAHVLAQMLHESGSLRLTVEGIDSDNPPDYWPYIGRGLIQITYRANYDSYGQYAGENFIGPSNYNKMAQLPHSVISVGWYWSEFKGLTKYSDVDDFIYCTALVNGGFNGYDDRLQFLNRAVTTLDIRGCAKLNKHGVYELSDSKAYENAKFSFAWGIWSDPGGGKSGKTKDRAQAIIGYRRFLELYNSSPTISGNTTRTYYASGRTAVVAKTYAENRLLALGEVL